MTLKPSLMSPCTGCSRRAALQGLGLVALVPLVGGCPSSNTPDTGVATTCSGGLCIDLADQANAALAAVDGALLIDGNGDTIIVVRTSDTTVVAVSAVCTHSGCLVGYQTSSETIYCDCHGSQFAVDGGVLAGPARRPLRAYVATIAESTITIGL